MLREEDKAEKKKKEFSHKVSAKRLLELQERNGWKNNHAARFFGFKTGTYNRYVLGAKIPPAEQYVITHKLGLPEYYFDPNVDIKHIHGPALSPKFLIDAIRVVWEGEPTKRKYIETAISILWPKQKHAEAVMELIKKHAPKGPSKA